MARRLAVACQTVFEAVLSGEDAVFQSNAGPSDDRLAREVVAACQAAIARALTEPAAAVRIAGHLGTTLDTLRLVQAQVEGGAASSFIAANAESMVRGALVDLLTRFSPDADRVERMLETTAIPLPVTPGATPVIPSSLPTFGKVSQDYIDMRIDADTEEHKDVKYLRLRRKTFIEIVGDRPVNLYFPSDLQKYVNMMQYWPKDATKRKGNFGRTALDIIESNKNFELEPIAKKTLQDGYVVNIRTMMRYGMANHRYRDPFSDARIRWPLMLRASVPRESIGLDVLDEAFRLGVSSGLLAEAILPLVSILTGRRLGLLAYLTGADLRAKFGVTIAQTSQITLSNGMWKRSPIKTDESATFFVMHDFLVEIGFVDWAKNQDGYIFKALHEHPDPASYVSKIMNKLLKRAGAIGNNVEVFHSLRGDAITRMRGDRMESRTVRLQAGHELGDVHDLYGEPTLSEAEARAIAKAPLTDAIDWTRFRGLDFEALAAKRRPRGRPVGSGNRRATRGPVH